MYEIAAMVSYLAGPEAGYITGASPLIDGGFAVFSEELYAVNDDPQPQDFCELGLMKLKPWRMRVSSKSRIMPFR